MLAERQFTISCADFAQDTPYLSQIVQQIEAEMKEREDLESIVVTRRK